MPHCSLKIESKLENIMDIMNIMGVLADNQHHFFGVAGEEYEEMLDMMFDGGYSTATSQTMCMTNRLVFLKSEFECGKVIIDVWDHDIETVTHDFEINIK